MAINPPPSMTCNESTISPGQRYKQHLSGKNRRPSRWDSKIVH
ncbi:hypothetical protein M7I_5534 [Glarea lozoyensis 74030]|uniref:Uncharacterized protein n=1 Tax=Glarea lozoyensis (strain ATCC 74030 / MF5533) TaxID=1104152 RepID=H0ES57_GLAL7|nr:hypothetical protein M7I_5534 [Glarea lozoyensis 74030]